MPYTALSDACGSAPRRTAAIPAENLWDRTPGRSPPCPLGYSRMSISTNVNHHGRRSSRRWPLAALTAPLTSAPSRAALAARAPARCGATVCMLQSQSTHRVRHPEVLSLCARLHHLMACSGSAMLLTALPLHFAGAGRQRAVAAGHPSDCPACDWPPVRGVAGVPG
eukprot:scaffold117492_cov57-Phaeocystis_antarctica.AAC.4